jgi:Na+/proline symporter
MEIVVIAAFLLAFLFYIIIGAFYRKKVKTLGDMLPVTFGKQAQIKNHREFSASTVAVSVSLSTLIVAYFELAPFFGLWWLMWTVVTTALGIYFVRLFAKRIWERLSTYKNRPTIHEFLGTEYNSRMLTIISAICTSIGFLGVFATELTVGGKFLAGLVTVIPEWVSVIIICLIGLTYTLMGGYRVVIVTDRIGMWAIWLFIIVISGFYLYSIKVNLNWHVDLNKLPPDILSIKWRDGLTSFLLGIFLINVPFYVGDMSIWQRIAGAQKRETVFKGLWSSVINSALIWTALLLLAVFVYLVIVPVEGENPLITLLKTIGTGFGVVGKGLLFLSLFPLLMAMFSVSSTQLTATLGAVYEDIISKIKGVPLSERIESEKELRLSRRILIIAALSSFGVVQVLTLSGFSIADLVFSIFGSQLSLTPLVLFVLFNQKGALDKLYPYAIAAVILGFLSGWTVAFIGKIGGDGNLVFISPVFSFGISLLVMIIGKLNLRRHLAS